MSLPRNFLDVDGHLWAYLEFGQGEPLVMLHGMLTNADFLMPIANALSLKFRVILIDLPGFGFTNALSKNDYKNITRGIINFFEKNQFGTGQFLWGFIRSGLAFGISCD
ncbi:MAG: alpha/beta fold hydrolase [Patescibacteria group bacterium]